MESESSTKEENKRDDTLKNDKQILETAYLLDKTSPNFEGDQNTRNKDDKGETPENTTGNGDDDDIGKRGVTAAVNVSNTPETAETTAQPRLDYESQVLLEVTRLLSAPALPEEEEEDEMSRLGSKSKAANKSISRPSLSKVPGELSGQPSVKNTKEDVKYWKSREQELLDRIAVLENKAALADAAKDKFTVLADAGKDKFHGPVDQVAAQRQEKLEEDLTATAKEKENYKNRLQQIEKELFAKQKEQTKEPNLKGMKCPDEIINHLKAQNEDLRGALAKMTAILRDKTALCVSQEKKVAALTNQVESLKEVVAITKDLLNIRNMEVQHISNDIQAMESKIECERQRHNQMLIKMDEAVKLNSELKKEYENQMKLFQHLRDSYEEKIRMISQSSGCDDNKEQEQQRNAIGNVKATTQTPGKTSRGSNFKVNFQDT